MAKMMEMMTALVKEKGPMQSPDIAEPPQSRATQDPLYPLRFTPPHIHAMQRGYPQREPTVLEQPPVPSAHLGQGMFVSNPSANPSDPIVPDLDDPVEVARLRIDDNNAHDKYRILEEMIKAVEGAEVFSALSAKELSLVPDLVLPPKFKAPDFEKYDGTRCPKAHLIMFCRKMTGYVNDDKLLVHCFQDSLVGSALRWYNRSVERESDHGRIWHQHSKHTETFRQYAQRWRDISAQVEPLLTKTEITVLFINTLKAPFYDKLVGSATKDFADIVISGELIENAVKSRRMEGPEGSKRAVPVKKKEAEADMVGIESHCAPNSYPAQSRPHYRPPSNFYFPPQGPYYQVPLSYPVYAMNNQRPFTVFPPNTMPTQSQPKNEQRPTRPNPERPQFTPIPISYGELYPKLLEKQLISPHYMAPLKPPYPKWYDPNASCVYHAGNQGHSTENGLAFKRRVQGLIDAGILRFDGVSNVTGNPLPNHTGRNVNAVTNEDNWQAKGYVAEVMTPLRKVWEMMIENGLLCPPSRILKEESKKDQSFCDFHGIEGHDIQSCKEFRKLLQDMMDNKEVKVFDRVEGAEEGEICVSNNQSMASPYSVDRPLVIYYEAKKEEVSREVKPSLIIEVPTHFSYKDNNAVPWKYDVNIVVPEGEKSKVMNEDVSGVGHFTRSERCYSPETVEPKKKVAGPSQKGKAPMYEVENDVETQLEQEVKKAVNEDEAHEFLKWANNLNADNFISFSDDEIPPNGRGSVKALHITTNCKGYILPNVLIDNGSTLNVMPLATLSRMLVDIAYLRHCHSVVRAFDGTQREVMGKIKIPLKLGPCAYDIEFQVMDITPSYNFLLGRPWIHSVGAVPSSLHQKVKFIMDSRLITVAGEEDIVASISADVPYIEISEDAIECSFRSLEFINAAFVTEGNKIPIPKLSRNTKMGIKLTVGNGARGGKV
ncbi:uncharacterized protein [Gossypium hirsutum]|uniref:Retrotransposon gag domain-containing protein n=1 Tax=Gossypium hirsutum TaxID=3635 RepID=A0A1U8ITA3_GOSHI|nr:uncharacterized protein LOC107900111 [Gossypium hirsutum]